VVSGIAKSITIKIVFFVSGEGFIIVA